MLSNNGGLEVGYLAGRHPGRIGWLLSPAGYRRPPEWLPHALDNGAFSAWTRREPWDEAAYLRMLEKARLSEPPLWALVPDVVADRAGTLKQWEKWSPHLRRALPGIPLGFAVQDGMGPSDVPADADLVFVGGSTLWKWRHLLMWCKAFQRVHVGRVNSEGLLWEAHKAGAESCDGTGWMRGDRKQLAGLRRYLEQSGAKTRPQMELAL